jgi:hypothetical protein
LSGTILKRLDNEFELENHQLMKEQFIGNYSRMLKDSPKMFLARNVFMNYIHLQLKCKFNKEKGRAVYAAAAIPKGELICVEKPLAISIKDRLGMYLIQNNEQV